MIIESPGQLRSKTKQKALVASPFFYIDKARDDDAKLGHPLDKSEEADEAEEPNDPTHGRVRQKHEAVAQKHDGEVLAGRGYKRDRGTGKQGGAFKRERLAERAFRSFSPPAISILFPRQFLSPCKIDF